jgi:hypothetical protein
MNDMDKLIENLFQKIGTTDDKGEVMLKAQIAFLDGGVAVGGLKRGPVEGSYQLLTPILDKRTGQPAGAIDVYFFPSQVRYVAIPREEPEARIATPPGVGRLVMP